MATEKARTKTTTTGKFTLRGGKGMTTPREAATGRFITDYYSILREVLGLSADDVSNRKIRTRIHKGFHPKRLRSVMQYLNIGDNECALYISIPKRTLARRKTERLTATESDRVYRLAKLAALATELFEGDRNEAINWLKSPNAGLDRETPLEYAETIPGYEEVVQLIGRLEHGVF